jgi:hypothetical protein
MVTGVCVCLLKLAKPHCTFHILVQFEGCVGIMALLTCDTNGSYIPLAMEQRSFTNGKGEGRGSSNQAKEVSKQACK